LPLPSTPVTVQVTLGPTGVALSGTGGPLTSLTTGQIPRYQQSLLPLAPLTAVNFNSTAPVPQITGITPSSGSQGTVNATIAGFNLTGATSVTFSGTGVTAVIGGGSSPT